MTGFPGPVVTGRPRGFVLDTICMLRDIHKERAEGKPKLPHSALTLNTEHPMSQAGNVLITPLLFEEEHLVRTIDMNDGETWFVGLDICRVLGIRDHKQALERLDEDERGWCTIPPQIGDEQARSMVVVSEPGVYRLVFTSRKPVAERFKRWLAHDIIPSIRKTGSYGPQQDVLPSAPERRIFPDWPLEELRAKRSTVDMYRMNWGLAAAQWIAPQLGYPVPPPELINGQGQFVLALVPLS